MPACRKLASTLFFFLHFLNGCAPEKNTRWQTFLPELGSYSSPRVADLNKDGTLDVVMGAGGREDHYSDSAVIALDGKTGKLLWKIGGVNQFVGSAVFNDVTGDGIPDVFIGGRWAELAAIDGSNGNLLWNFFPQRRHPNPADSGWYNFTTPQWVPDQDGDGSADLIIANGGNALAAPHDLNRPAGRLLVLGSRTGKILAQVQMPDGKETYLSVVCLDAGNTGNPRVYFGTGGETIGGRLYRTTLRAIMQQDISQAVVLASSEQKGFIAAPVLADINRDGYHDVIVNAVDGRMIAIDGKTDSVLWQHQFPGTEAYTMPAVGFFNADSIPDLFCNFAIGVFPDLTRSIRFMVDGRSGRLAYQDTVSSFQYASGVAADLTGQGYDQVVVYQSEMKRRQFDNHYFSYLFLFDFRTGNHRVLGDTAASTNLAATPWIGDLDGNNKMDFLFSGVRYDPVRFDLQHPHGLFVHRFETSLPVPKPPVWGAYMGSDYKSVFPH